MNFKKGFKSLKQCRICHKKDLSRILNFGSMPLPNGFLKKKDFKTEKFYPLEVLFCSDCSLVQLAHIVNPQVMFQNYSYIPSLSRVMSNNFTNLVFNACKQGFSKSSLVLDIGSNDGTLLSLFKAYGIRVLGIDPAKNLAQIARLKGIPTEVGLFSKKMAEKILSTYGSADIITATNVVAHINNLDELLDGVKILLKKHGIFITEFPYLLDLYTKNQFDTIYHEHLSYFSFKSWTQVLERHNLQIADVRRLQIHGGSLRLTHRLRTSAHFSNIPAVNYLINLEKQSGLHDFQSYLKLSNNVYKIQKRLNKLLKNLKSKRRSIIGLGAPAKGNIMLNFCNVGPKTLDYIADATPFKQGLYSPGRHIPICSEEKVFKDGFDYGLILAWNFASEIMRKFQRYQKKGGRFIIPIPEVTIV